MTTFLLIALGVGATLGFLWAYNEFELYSRRAVVGLLLGGVAIVGLLVFVEWSSTFLESKEKRVSQLIRFLSFQGYHGGRAMALLLFGYLMIIWACIAAVLNSVLRIGRISERSP